MRCSTLLSGYVALARPLPGRAWGSLSYLFPLQAGADPSGLFSRHPVYTPSVIQQTLTVFPSDTRPDLWKVFTHGWGPWDQIHRYSGRLGLPKLGCIMVHPSIFTCVFGPQGRRQVLAERAGDKLETTFYGQAGSPPLLCLCPRPVPSATLQGSPAERSLADLDVRFLSPRRLRGALALSVAHGCRDTESPPTDHTARLYVHQARSPGHQACSMQRIWGTETARDYGRISLSIHIPHRRGN